MNQWRLWTGIVGAILMVSIVGCDNDAEGELSPQNDVQSTLGASAGGTDEAGEGTGSGSNVRLDGEPVDASEQTVRVPGPTVPIVDAPVVVGPQAESCGRTPISTSRLAEAIKSYVAEHVSEMPFEFINPGYPLMAHHCKADSNAPQQATAYVMIHPPIPEGGVPLSPECIPDEEQAADPAWDAPAECPRFGPYVLQVPLVLDEIAPTE